INSANGTTGVFNNTGQNIKSYGGFASALLGVTNGVHKLVTIKDPLTGHSRLIIANDQGIYTDVDMGNGASSAGIGNAAPVFGSRVGNLQIAQFYYGTVQPSTLAADLAGALFYGMSEDNGFPGSDAQALSNVNL